VNLQHMDTSSAPGSGVLSDQRRCVQLLSAARRAKAWVVTVALLTGWLTPQLHAQVSFEVYDREVQIHGFLSEALACSDENNYLRMQTSEGSLFTEAGLNASTQLTDHL